MGTGQLGLISIISKIKLLTLQMFKCSFHNKCYAKQIQPKGNLFKTLVCFFFPLKF